MAKEKYEITPKGIAWLAAVCNGLVSNNAEDDRRFESFWNEFELWMYKKGFIKQEERD